MDSYCFKEWASTVISARFWTLSGPQHLIDRNMCRLSRWTVILILIGPWRICAQTNEAKLLPADGAANDFFGGRVSLSGERVLIGAGFDDDNGADAGAAYIFRFDGSSWIEEAKLIASDGEAGDNFASSVSLSGNRALVGASKDGDNGMESGSAYIFQFNETSWTEETKLIASDGQEGDFFGRSVSLSGDRALIGADLDDEIGDNSGSAHIFYFDGISWTEEAKLIPSDAAAGDAFGASVSLLDDYALIGAFQDDDNGSLSGSAYVFHFDGSSWSEVTKLTASDGAGSDFFGLSVSLSLDIALIGAYGNDENGSLSGSAYIFRFDGTNWFEEAKLLPSDGGTNHTFGISVSLYDEITIIGAPGDDDHGIFSGSIYIFQYDGSSWAEFGKVSASDGQNDDLFGSSVSISSNQILVGSPYDDDNGTSSGSAYVYTLEATSVDIKRDLAQGFLLSQNFPNPFNPSTTISFSLPGSSDVSLKIFNLLGEEVATLVSGKMDAETHTVQWEATGQPSGVYFYRLRAGDFLETKKLLLLR